MPGRASKPVRRVESRDTSFERLLDSDEAAALLKIHPKTLQKMARDGEITSTGRNDVSKEHRHWNFRGIPNGFGGPIGRGCAPLNNQPADSAATSQERQFRDSCEALSGTRTSGYFSPSEACPGASSHRRGIGRIYRASSRRADWSTVAGRGLRRSGGARSALGRDDGAGRTQDRSLGERCSLRCRTCRIAVEAQVGCTLQPSNRLGVCFSDDERRATTLAGNALAPTRKASGQKSGNYEASVLPHVSSYVHNFADSKQRGREGGAGVVAACQQPNHARPVRPSGNARETRSAKQDCSACPTKGEGTGLSGPYWTMSLDCHFPVSA